MIGKTGSMIKKVAIASFCIEVSVLFLGVIVTLTKIVSIANSFRQIDETITVSSNGGTVVFWGFLGIVVVIAILFVKNLLIYGLGELIENSAYNRYSTEYLCKQMVQLSDTSEGVQFLCNQSINDEKTLAAIYQVLAKAKESQERARGSGINFEWECPDCGMQNPLKARFCMSCGQKN